MNCRLRHSSAHFSIAKRHFSPWKASEMGHVTQRQEWRGEERKLWNGRRERVWAEMGKYVCSGFLLTVEHTDNLERHLNECLFSYVVCLRVTWHSPAYHQFLLRSQQELFSKIKWEWELLVYNDFCDGRQSFRHPSIPPTAHKLPLILTGCIKTMQRVRALI